MESSAATGSWTRRCSGEPPITGPSPGRLLASPAVEYRHTQSGRVTIVVAVFVIVGSIALSFVSAPVAAAAASAGLFILLLVYTFNRLTVTVADGSVTARFGLGWPRRRILLDDITTAAVVRSKWWYGWGIRLIPGGWMFNVWGLDAVELKLTSGRRFWIGTDEPDELLAAVGRH